MLIINIEELPKGKIFNCCSYNMMKFLEDHNIKNIEPVTKKWNKKKEKWVDCYVFIETPYLNELRLEWIKRKQDGNLYFDKESGVT